MDIAALIISALSLVVALVGTLLANRRSIESHRLALEAKSDAREAVQSAAWSKSVEAVQHLIGLDPMTDDVSGPLRDLRIANTALVDELQWAGLDRWLGEEQALGATLLRDSVERRVKSGIGVGSPDQRLAALSSVQEWAMALMNNLRLFRREGEKAESLLALTNHAHDVALAVHKRNGWKVPSGPSLMPLEGGDLPK